MMKKSQHNKRKASPDDAPPTPEKFRTLRAVAREAWAKEANENNDLLNDAQNQGAPKKQKTQPQPSPAASSTSVQRKPEMSQADQEFFENLRRRRERIQNDPFFSFRDKMIPVGTIVNGKLIPAHERPFWSEYTRPDWRSAMIRRKMQLEGYRSVFASPSSQISSSEQAMVDVPKDVEKPDSTLSNKKAKP